MPRIVLNGITSILGDRQALFTVQWADRQSAFILAEGEAAEGIKLVAVDFKAGNVTICNQGLVQKIALHQAVASIVASTPDGQSSAAVGAGQGSDLISTPPGAVVPSPVASRSGNAAGLVVRSAATGEAAEGTTGSAGLASADPDKAPDPWWLIGSKNLEQARIETAEQVRRGEREPYPLTPLTPPGTPAELVGSGRLYFVAGN